MLGKANIKKTALILILLLLIFQVLVLAQSNIIITGSDHSDRTLVFKAFTRDLSINIAREIRSPLNSLHSGKTTVFIGATVLLIVLLKILYLRALRIIIDLRKNIYEIITIYFHGSKYKYSYSYN